MLPEEAELIRLENEQKALSEQVATSETALETLKADISRFQRRYYSVVGKLYARLDEIDAQISALAAKAAPKDVTSKSPSRRRSGTGETICRGSGNNTRAASHPRS